MIELKFRPFKPVIYGEGLGELTAPPFDGITPEQEKELKKNPYNITHLTLPGRDHGIEHSRELMSSWIDQGVISAIGDDTVFILVQEFRLNHENIDRIGVIGVTDIYPDTQEISPHERTFPGIVETRASLMRALGAQLEPLFLTVLNNTLERVLKRAISGSRPDRVFEEPLGVKNSVYFVSDRERIGRIMEAVEKDRAIVADGHHRLKAAQTIASSATGEERDFWSQSMVYLSSIYDRGLLISGVHRLVSSGYFAGSEDKRLETYFLIRDRETIDTLNSITIYDGKFRSLEPRDSTLKMLFGEGHSHEDVVGSRIVNDIIFNRILGMTEQDLESSVRYTHDVSVAVRSVDQGDFDFTVLMPTWNKDSFIKQAMGGQVLPQKSTYFYPKIPSGIAMRKFQPSGNSSATVA